MGTHYLSGNCSCHLQEAAAIVSWSVLMSVFLQSQKDAHVQACKFCPAGFTPFFFHPQVVGSMPKKRKKRNTAHQQKTKSPQLPSNMNLCNTGFKMFYKDENPFNMFVRFQELDWLIGKESFFFSHIHNKPVFQFGLNLLERLNHLEGKTRRAKPWIHFHSKRRFF